MGDDGFLLPQLVFSYVDAVGHRDDIIKSRLVIHIVRREAGGSRDDIRFAHQPSHVVPGPFRDNIFEDLRAGDKRISVFWHEVIRADQSHPTTFCRTNPGISDHVMALSVYDIWGQLVDEVINHTVCPSRYD